MATRRSAVSGGESFFSPKGSRILADEYVRYLDQQNVQNSYDLLTDREEQLLLMLVEGRSNKDIATVLNLSPTTVVCHRQHIFQKLNFHSLADLTVYSIRKGAISAARGTVAHGS